MLADCRNMLRQIVGNINQPRSLDTLDAKQVETIEEFEELNNDLADEETRKKMVIHSFFHLSF